MKQFYVDIRVTLTNARAVTSGQTSEQLYTRLLPISYKSVIYFTRYKSAKNFLVKQSGKKYNEYLMLFDKHNIVSPIQTVVYDDGYMKRFTINLGEDDVVFEYILGRY